MKKTMKKFVLSLFVCLSSALFQFAHAQWATFGNTASGASSSTPNEFVGTTNNFNLNFKTNSSVTATPRMTITTGGFVGIGTTSPTTVLDVQGTGGINSSSTYKIGHKQVLSVNGFGLRIGGNNVFKVGVNTDSPIFKFDVRGGSINTDSMYRINGNPVIKSGAAGIVQIGETNPNVGIGTATPVGKLHIKSPSGINANLLLDRGASSDSALISFRTAGAEVWRLGTVADSGGSFFQNFVLNNVVNPSFGSALTVLRSTSNVGIGTGSPGFRLVVNNQTTVGSYTTTGWAHSSDARLKTNIMPLENSLDKIMKLQGVSYNWKKLPNENNQIGFIAQEVEKVFPEVIVKDQEGNYSMVYQNLTAPIIEAIKEQQKQLNDKDLQIAALNNRIEQFEKALLQAGITPEQKSGVSTSLKNVAALEQNEPNPFSSKTMIRYFIPSTANYAMIKIFSSDGSELKSIDVSSKGSGSVEISAHSFAAGVYSYLLLVDGKTIDSKQLILSK